MKENLTGGITDDQLKSFKKKHGKLRLVSLKGKEGNEEHFWFKKPDMATMSACAKFTESDPIKAGQIFFSNCLIHGDESAAEDVDKFTSILPLITDMLQKYEAEVKEF